MKTFTVELGTSLNLISSNSLRKTSTIHGRNIIDISEGILTSSHIYIYGKVQSLLLPKFKNIMEEVDATADFNNEVLFLYSLSADGDTLSAFSDILQPISFKTRQFYGVLCHGLMNVLVKKQV